MTGVKTKISKEMFKAAKESYGVVMTAQGKPERGIQIVQQIIKMSGAPFYTIDILTLKAIKENLNLWYKLISKEEKVKFEAVYDHLYKEVDSAMEWQHNLNELKVNKEI